jgi:hypothetical protein
MVIPQIPFPPKKIFNCNHQMPSPDVGAISSKLYYPDQKFSFAFCGKIELDSQPGKISILG